MWDVSNVRNAKRLFKDCIFNMEICNWNFDNIECMDEMFKNTKFFCTPIKFVKEFELRNTFYDQLFTFTPVKKLLGLKHVTSYDNIAIPTWQVHLINNIWNPLKKALFINVKESDTNTDRNKYNDTVIRGWNLLQNNPYGNSGRILVGFFLYQNYAYAQQQIIKYKDPETGENKMIHGMTYNDLENGNDEDLRKIIHHELHFKGSYDIYHGWDNKIKKWNRIDKWNETNFKTSISYTEPSTFNSFFLSNAPSPKLKYYSYNQYSHIEQLINAIRKDVIDKRWGGNGEKDIPSILNISRPGESGEKKRERIRNFVEELTDYHLKKIISEDGWRIKANNPPDNFIYNYVRGGTFNDSGTDTGNDGITVRLGGESTYGFPFTPASQSFYGTLNMDQFIYNWTPENAYQEKTVDLLNYIEDRNLDGAKNFKKNDKNYPSNKDNGIPPHERGVYFINFQDLSTWYFENIIKMKNSRYNDPSIYLERSNNSNYKKQGNVVKEYKIDNATGTINELNHTIVRGGYLNYKDKSELDGCDKTWLKRIEGADTAAITDKFQDLTNIKMLLAK